MSVRLRAGLLAKDPVPPIAIAAGPERPSSIVRPRIGIARKRIDAYTCLAGKTLTTTGHVNADNGIRYITSVPVCRACPLKPNCSPNMPSRRIVRDVHEAARDVARALAKTKAYEISRHLRKKVEMLFAHLKRILRLDRLR